jgi:hypothetical protein
MRRTLYYRSGNGSLHREFTANTDAEIRAYIFGSFGHGRKFESQCPIICSHAELVSDVYDQNEFVELYGQEAWNNTDGRFNYHVSDADGETYWFTDESSADAKELELLCDVISDSDRGTYWIGDSGKHVVQFNDLEAANYFGCGDLKSIETNRKIWIDAMAEFLDDKNIDWHLDHSPLRLIAYCDADEFDGLAIQALEAVNEAQEIEA